MKSNGSIETLASEVQITKALVQGLSCLSADMDDQSLVM